MKLQANNVNAFLKNKPEHIRVILVYGPNAGLIIERIAQLKYSFIGNNVHQVIQLFADHIKDNPSIFIEEINSVSLFSDNNHKVIIIHNIKDILTKTIQSCIADIDKNVLVLLHGDDLPPSSSLRKLCENEPHLCASLPCYADTPIALKEFITNKLRQENISITTSALTWLANNLGNDRGITTTEIEKLILYVYFKKSIDIDDVEILENSVLIALDKFVYALFNLEVHCFYSILCNLLEENNPIVITRIIANHVHKLLYVKSLTAHISLDLAIKEIKPPIFFTHVENFKKQVSFWSLPKLKQLLINLTYLEIELKQSSTLGDYLIKDFTIKNFLAS